MWSGPERLLALDELINRCETSQVKHMMQVIEPQFQRDFISLLPKEVQHKSSPLCCLRDVAPLMSSALQILCFITVLAASPVRAHLPGSQRPAAGRSDLQELEDPG